MKGRHVGCIRVMVIIQVLPLKDQAMPQYSALKSEEGIEENGYQTCAKADFVVKGCIFDMGTDCSTAFATRFSGIFLKRGKSAIIEGCEFLGGSGSAIVALNDPYLHVHRIQITGNLFVNNGQPTFSERSAKEVVDFKKQIKKYVTIPTSEITPDPASVELWQLH